MQFFNCLSLAMHTLTQDQLVVSIVWKVRKPKRGKKLNASFRLNTKHIFVIILIKANEKPHILIQHIFCDVVFPCETVYMCSNACVNEDMYFSFSIDSFQLLFANSLRRFS